MDWNAIGALAELVGAAAVVVSLLYLARQVRSGSTALQTTMRDASFGSVREWNYSVAADPDLPWIFQQGCRDFDSLDQKEAARFVLLAYSFLKVFENIFLHYKAGTVDSKTWEHNRHILVAYASQPGIQRYIEARWPIFEPGFREVLENLEPPAISVPDEAFSRSSQPGAS